LTDSLELNLVENEGAAPAVDDDPDVELFLGAWA
jgi:hypothetical protein